MKFISILYLCSLLLIGCNISSEKLEPLPSPILKESEFTTTFIADSSNRAGWWKPITSQGDYIFIAFNSQGKDDSNCKEKSNHMLTLAYKSYSTNWQYKTSLSKNKKKYWTGCDDVGHRQPTIAVDGDGAIHIWAGMHGEPDGCCYLRASEKTANLEIKDDFKNIGRFTYPIAKTAPNGDIYLIIRDLPNVASTSEQEKFSGSGKLFHWNNLTDKWRLIESFAANTFENNQFNAPVYPNDLYIDENNIAHILWEWAIDKTSDKRFQGSYIQYDTVNKMFTSASNTLLNAPISLDTVKSYPEITFEPSNATLSNTNFIQSAKLLVHEEYCTPCVVYRSVNNNSSRIMMTRWSNNTWQNPEQISDKHTASFATLDVEMFNNTINVFYALKEKGVYKASRKTTDEQWEINQVLNSAAEDIRLSVEQMGDTTMLYINLFELSQNESHLIIQEH